MNSILLLPLSKDDDSPPLLDLIIFFYVNNNLYKLLTVGRPAISDFLIKFQQNKDLKMDSTSNMI
jgi:hypothetical protein